MIVKDYRMKIYYPDDQIIKNLITGGKEFMILQDFSEYIGFYHRYSTGEVFTEHQWNPSKSKRLIRFRNLSEPQKKYYDLKHFSKSVHTGGVKRKKSNNNDEYYRYSAPRPAKRKLTQKELDAGKKYRFFVILIFYQVFDLHS